MAISIYNLSLDAVQYIKCDAITLVDPVVSETVWPVWDHRSIQISNPRHFLSMASAFQVFEQGMPR